MQRPVNRPAALTRFAVREERIQLGPLAVRMLEVDRLETLVDAEALLRDGDAPEPPYWAHLWTGSRVLGELVATEIDCAGRRVVDLGCGLGLAGIAAALRGGDVVLADYVHDAAVFAGANAALNGCSAHAIQMDLRRPCLRGPVDVCLAADITYDPTLQRALATFAAERMSSIGEMWCVESVRTTDEGFRRACERLGLCSEERAMPIVDEGRAAIARVTRVHRAIGA